MFSSFAFRQLRNQAKEVTTMSDVSNRVEGTGIESKAGPTKLCKRVTGDASHAENQPLPTHILKLY